MPRNPVPVHRPSPVQIAERFPHLGLVFVKVKILSVIFFETCFEVYCLCNAIAIVVKSEGTEWTQDIFMVLIMFNNLLCIFQLRYTN